MLVINISLLLLSCAQNTTKPADTNPTAIDTAGFDQGILWKIEKPGNHASYLFGTVHSEDQRVIELPDQVVQAFKKSTDFAMEVLLTKQASRTLQAAMFFNGDDNLKSVLDANTYQQTLAAMTTLSFPEDQVLLMKPWAIFTLLSMPKPKTGLFLDFMLYKSAKTLDMQVHGLETIDEQIAVFDQMSLDNQIIILKDTLNNLTKMDSLFDKTIQIYLSRNLKAVMKLNADYLHLADSRVGPIFEERLITNRNKIMAKRIIPLLSQGKIFIAVGALHLPGKVGILNLLKQEGYQLTALY